MLHARDRRGEAALVEEGGVPMPAYAEEQGKVAMSYLLTTVPSGSARQQIGEGGCR